MAVLMFVLVVARDGRADTTPARVEPMVDPELTGEPYAQARRVLLAHRNVPMDLGTRNKDCDDAGDICGFQELESCFVDIPYCTFGWKTRDGHFLKVEVHDPAYVRGAPIAGIWKTDVWL